MFPVTVCLNEGSGFGPICVDRPPSVGGSILKFEMSASNYLLELRQRRATLLENAIHCLGIPLGSLNHEVVLKYAVESLTHHHLLDTEAEKVCSCCSAPF